MGTSIHSVVQVKKDGFWENIPELPEDLYTRNYRTFALLNSDLRDSFGIAGFAPKGMPEDFGPMKIGWKSMFPRIKEIWETGKSYCLVHKRCLTPARDVSPEEITQEEYERLEKLKPGESAQRGYLDRGWKLLHNEKTYYARVAHEDDMWELRLNKEIYPDFQEWIKTTGYDEYFDADKNDYGEYDIEFDIDDYYGHSYVTLKELREYDYTDYKSVQCKVSKMFYDTFINAGGVLPEIFRVRESVCGDISDCFREALEPTVTIVWPEQNELKVKAMPMFNLIGDLEALAEKYNVGEEDIRAVYCFDN